MWIGSVEKKKKSLKRVFVAAVLCNLFVKQGIWHTHTLPHKCTIITNSAVLLPGTAHWSLRQFITSQNYTNMHISTCICTYKCRKPTLLTTSVYTTQANKRTLL